ncbi:hypothetical protein QUF79_06075 [Fictibacillus enclensis]|uniref:hypothetical protein n=1 Tax=Fictibacillus enclensis TaxID=1017270 RepID=UPI0025A0ACED|nr:hypothetical protein [Fictibacillus enclensis]MDM5197582.1 hypothetical protein [Fictibacillus enclensis]
MNLISLLSGNGFVMFNKDLARKVSVNGAIIFGQLCSSYESFSNKNMLTVKDNKEYFFLTSETLYEETALTYKQQLKAIKELEVAGYIETKVMGVPSKKFFRITDKIVDDLITEGNPRNDKREDLAVSTVGGDIEESSEDNLSLDQRESLGMTKGHSKPLPNGSCIKKKNKKEQDKNNKINNCNYKNLDSNEFKKVLIDCANDFYTQFALNRWTKKQWNTLIEKFAADTVESGRYIKIPQDKIKGYVYKSLETMASNSDYKHSEEFLSYVETMKEIVTKSSNTYRESRTPDWL